MECVDVWAVVDKTTDEALDIFTSEDHAGDELAANAAHWDRDEADLEVRLLAAVDPAVLHLCAVAFAGALQAFGEWSSMAEGPMVPGGPWTLRVREAAKAVREALGDDGD